MLRVRLSAVLDDFISLQNIEEGEMDFDLITG
jgi:hypothetical protein